jgi:hypothetical protein
MDAIAEFEVVLNSIAGLFVDSQDAFALLQAKVESEAEGKDWDSPIYYGDGPMGAAKYVPHTTTIADRIARNADCGENATFVGNIALVTIYSYGEDHYRAQIAHARAVTKDEIKSDVMGDIRQLRHSILHNRGLATKEVAACKVLKWFSEGDEIFLSQQMFLQMISYIRADLYQLRSNPSLRGTRNEAACP